MSDKDVWANFAWEKVGGEPVDWNKIPGEKVWGFEGEQSALSNHSSFTVRRVGRDYPSIAFAHAAMRCDYDAADPSLGRNLLRGNNRRNVNPGNYLKGNWRGDDIGVMEAMLLEKFDPELHPENAKVLLDTGDATLVAIDEPGVTLKGHTWGVNKEGVGHNVLGGMLEEVRGGIKVGLTVHHLTLLAMRAVGVARQPESSEVALQAAD